MSPKRTSATAIRVLKQLHHDRRALAMIFVVPPLLLIILKYVFEDSQPVFESIAPMLLGIFPFVLMFLVTSITTMRERTNGTLERLLTTRLTKLDFMMGYALAFSMVAFVQAVIASAVLLWLLDVAVLGGAFPILISAVLAAFLGTALGLFVSAFAATEFQAVQFMPAFIFPQFLICGLLVPRDTMTPFLQWLSDIMPLTYSVDAMKLITVNEHWTADLTRDLLVVTGFAIGALLLGSLTIRRQERT